jgi:nitrogen fixation protein NifU and related proteins
MNADLRALYEEVILEHNRHPRHYPKKPRGSTHHAHGFNPLCNDEIQVHLRVADDTIRGHRLRGSRLCHLHGFGLDDGRSSAWQAAG